MEKNEKIQVEISVPSGSLNVRHAQCPNGHSLIDPEMKIGGHPAVKVKVSASGKSGMIYLDPVYGSYDNIEKGIDIPMDAIAEFFCPECDISLTDTHENCHLCSSPLYVFHLPKGSIVEGCLKKGCFFHQMKIVDGEEQMVRLFSNISNSTLESFL